MDESKHLLRLVRGVHVHDIPTLYPAVLVVDDRVDDPVPDGLRAHELRTLDRFELHLPSVRLSSTGKRTHNKRMSETRKKRMHPTQNVTSVPTAVVNGVVLRLV